MTTQILIGIAVAWIITGFLLGFLMRKRGHEFYVWLVIGSALGPLALPIAFNRIRVEEGQRVENLEKMPRTTGDFDVLVALDGSDEANEALRQAQTLMMAEPTSITFVTVLDYEAQSELEEEQRVKAQDMLNQATYLVGDIDTHTEILHGEPAKVLTEYADKTGKDLIVMGARGRGASQRVFGSVTTALSSGAKVPVLVGARPDLARLPRIHPD